MIIFIERKFILITCYINYSRFLSFYFFITGDTEPKRVENSNPGLFSAFGSNFRILIQKTFNIIVCDCNASFSMH